MSNDTVSIIVPIYNVAPFLPMAIESLITQTYHNLEILLIDDGSTDDSGNIADTFATKDERIKVFHKPNGGLSDSRNFGLTHATGQYVYFFDSDDVLELNFISVAINDMQRTGAEIFCSNYCLIDEQNQPSTIGRKRGAIDEVRTGKASLLPLLENQLDCYVWQFVFKRSILTATAFEFKNMLYEDLVATPQLLIRANHVIFNSQPLYKYRIRQTSIVHSTSLKKLNDLQYGIDYFVNFMRKNVDATDQQLNNWCFPLLLSLYVGFVKFPQNVNKIQLKVLKQRIIKAKIDVINLSNIEKVKFYLIKFNLVKFVR
ncbi:glycosyltransferase family 2 protein [Periweissella fabalis]|uniref:Glycosyltransferase n=1 Tax=Periweissella fabalis TaxID=1070421 RepID=A0A7X6N2V0_9LACO|nr:glycosyltransferase [Periweissella fabalis]MCM0598110.1 glycosyltransferase [Periweissella fabalis]NKZ24766.1 glycosyltransferase [Periweissella fabalis]